MRSSLVARLFPLLAAVLFFSCSGGSGGPAPAATTQNPAPAPLPAPVPTPAPVLADLSGTISAPDFSAMDSDVNDPNSPPVANNDFDQAQALAVPAMVGGYATFRATGKADDNFADVADEVDCYRVTLAAGQSIVLSVSDYPGPVENPVELNLFLLDGNNGEIKGSSVGRVATATITVADNVAENGEYVIKVVAVSGASKYVLTVGQPQAPATAGEEVLRLEDDFVPGEVLVQFEDNAVVAGVADNLHDRAVTLGLVGRGGGPGRAMRMALPTMGQGEASEYRVLGASAASGEMRARLDTIRALKRVHGRPEVKCASLNYIRRPCAIPDDPSYPLQWNYPLINLPQAWEVSTDVAASVVVAVVDTGVFLAHPDLTDNLPDLFSSGNAGYDFVSNVTAGRDGNGIDFNPDDPGDNNTPGHSSFHGTHVAGIVAAASSNNLGVAGVSWHSRIMPVRVLGIGGGTSYDVMQGVRYAAGLANDSGKVPSRKADVINLSMAGGGFSSVEQQAYTAVRNQGVIVVAAAGNNASSTPSYPAAYSGVVSVAAVDMNKRQASYSNYGPTVDVAAPGGATTGVYSTWVNDSSGTRQPSYRYYAGTSMATPHVAGVVALMKSICPAMTPDQFDTLLASGAITEDLAANGAAVRDDKFGYGLIDALKAVQQASRLLAAGGIVTPILSVTPNQLDFGVSAIQQTVTASNAGGGNLTIHDASSNAAWLSVAATGGGSYTVTVDRTGLVAATYAAVITFTSNGGTINLPVTMTLGGLAASPGNAGFQYILLLDPLTKETVDTLTATSVNGVYTYSFAQVKPGNYYIVAGTDSNNNGLICEAGEACGGYPTVGLLQKITVGDSNLVGLDFATGFWASPGVATSALAAWPGRFGISRRHGN